ncbi:acetyl-CoA carboxylase biotin carboxyl carrier protein [Gemmatimonas sp.]|uniref:acetyl-CoA carboxylase biotin carboxyl carrier protein n=1 Tax=Gemmatimonas sp. TaxID=1962908 RepID=UPI00286E0A2D|nr:acetyl-CoA carboxylase biotin carboxyl carrier protein [Gemmatimonas sp.]
MIPFDSPAMIDLRYVKKLIEMLDGSTVDSIEISSDKGMKLRISKSSQQRVAAMTVAPQMAAPVAMAPVLPAGGAERPAGEGVAAAPKAEAPKVALLEIKSPMVGTYYSAPEPGAKPYVNVGDRISKGQIVCIIEAMKIMNELESEFDGVVREVNVTESNAVEYGQVLYRLDPTG